jgi:hypothetical protein
LFAEIVRKDGMPFRGGVDVIRKAGGEGKFKKV